MVRKRHFLIIGNVNTLDYNVWVDASQSYVGASRDIEYINVPGRNGDVVIDNGKYLNKPVKYVVHVMDKDSVLRFRSALQAQVGYVRIEDSHFPDEYRIGCIESGFDIDMVGAGNVAGSFDLVINCKPQRFLKDGEIKRSVGNGDIIYNPTFYEAEPLIYIPTAGRIVVNGYIIDTSYNHIYVDGMECDCYGNTPTPIGNAIQLFNGFPKLKPGENLIEINSGSDHVDITPNWWRI